MLLIWAICVFADAAAAPQEVLLPRTGAWLEYIKVITKLDADLAGWTANSGQPRTSSDARKSAREQLLQPSSARTRPLRGRAMPSYVANILKAGIATP